ncbi:MAG: hypothetical protein ACKOCD_04455 [Nitrospiraceae bacterium]
MECRKCRGLMVSERWDDFFEEARAWRCVNCGSLLDRLILRNRNAAVTLKKEPRGPRAAASNGGKRLEPALR